MTNPIHKLLRGINTAPTHGMEKQLAENWNRLESIVPNGRSLHLLAGSEDFCAKSCQANGELLDDGQYLRNTTLMFYSS